MSGRPAVLATRVHDGLSFQLRGWPSAVPTRTVLIIHHGLGEHGGRYDTFAQHLAHLPMHIWTYDVRGHGKTEGTRGDAAGLLGLAHDLDALLPQLVAEAGAEQAILFGHSMGAVALGTWLTDCKVPDFVKLLMFSAPPVVVARTFEVRVKARFGRLLQRIAPAMTLSNAIPTSAISSDPAEVARYEADPLVHDRLSIRLGLSLLDDGPQLLAKADRIVLPTLLWHGTEDPIVDIAGSRALFAALGSADKTFLERDGSRHESHHERRDRVEDLFARISGWLSERLPATASSAGREPKT